MAKKLTYKDSGVDLQRADAIAADIGRLAKSTYGPEVMGGVGGFAGLFSLGGEVNLLRGSYRNPVLAACTDGVGTKLKLAFLADKHDTLGIDLVAMSVNDLIVQGAEPLFFLDYIGMERKDPRVCRELLAGIVEGCKRSGCALLGGETAELPSMYARGEYDLAGFCVGVVEKEKVIDGHNVTPGDVVVGIHSSGLHSNGYSLVRKALLETAGLQLGQSMPELGCTLGEELLRPTHIYAKAIRAVLSHYKVKENVHSLANITGSALPGNIPRTVPNGLVVRIKKGSWKVPPVFALVRKAGDIAEEEMYSTFNMGIGMTILCPQYNASVIQGILEEHGFGSDIIGSVEAGLDSQAEAVVRFD